MDTSKLSRVVYCTYLTTLLLPLITIYFVVHLIVLQRQLILVQDQVQEVLDGLPISGGVTKRSTDSLPTAHGLLTSNMPGVEVMQMTGLIPTLQVKQHGKIGPWKMDNVTTINWATLRPNKYELEILKPGLYFIYAQIYYLTSEQSNSFEIVKTKDTVETISMCANQVSSINVNPPVEISCYTGIVFKLNTNDRVHLNQVEQNRYILCSPGFSHWGVIKLN